MTRIADAAADFAAQLLDALAARTAAEAGAPTSLVSVTFDVLSDAPARDPHTEVRIERVTKSLVFSAAELRNADGKRLMSATAVHKALR